MSAVSIRAEIEELVAVQRNLERLESFLHTLRSIVQSRADRFSGVQLCGAWSGKAAREFEDELKRTQQKVAMAADRTSGAARVINAEQLKVAAQIATAKIRLAATLAWEAAERAAANASKT